MKQSPDSISGNQKFTGSSYRFLSINPAFERLTGLVADDIVGKRVLEVIPDLEQSWIDRYGKVVITGDPVQFENFAESLGRHYVVSAFRTAPNQFDAIQPLALSVVVLSFCLRYRS